MAEVNTRSPALRNISIRFYLYASGMVLLSVQFCIAQDEVLVKIPAGTFRMGHGGGGQREATQTVTVNAFLLDKTEVTNEAFAKFVAATGHQTVAERTVSWDELRPMYPAGTPPPDSTVLNPGSLVFVPTGRYVRLNDPSRWWRWTTGANWQHPAGPESAWTGLENYPVVHVAYADAEAYCAWKGKRLPTEAEFEWASRGGLTDKKFAWGDELNPEGKFYANYFQGAFPVKDAGDDGYPGLAPVRSFPPNGYGVYDLIGNVWEWCSDPFQPRAGERESELLNQKPRVTKGGSFLCSPNYCSNYLPAGRQASEPNSGANHIGFRCAQSIPTAGR